MKFERRIARVPVVEEAERGGLLPAERLHGRAGRPHLEQEVVQSEWMKSNLGNNRIVADFTSTTATTSPSSISRSTWALGTFPWRGRRRFPDQVGR